MVSRLNLLSQAKLRSITQRCRPSFWPVSTPRRECEAFCCVQLACYGSACCGSLHWERVRARRGTPFLAAINERRCRRGSNRCGPTRSRRSNSPKGDANRAIGGRSRPSRTPSRPAPLCAARKDAGQRCAGRHCRGEKRWPARCSMLNPANDYAAFPSQVDVWCRRRTPLGPCSTYSQGPERAFAAHRWVSRGQSHLDGTCAGRKSASKCRRRRDLCPGWCHSNTFAQA